MHPTSEHWRAFGERDANKRRPDWENGDGGGGLAFYRRAAVDANTEGEEREFRNLVGYIYERATDYLYLHVKCEGKSRSGSRILFVDYNSLRSSFAFCLLEYERSQSADFVKQVDAKKPRKLRARERR